METKPIPPTRRAIDRALCVLFLAALAAPWVDELVRDDALRSPVPEGRNASPLPAWDWSLDGLQLFPEAYAAHFADTLGLRDKLLRWHSTIRLCVFDTSPTSDVLLGRDGWMFFTGEESLTTWRGTNPFDDDDLRAWQHALEVRRDQAARVGAKYCFVLGPNKETIYPDYMPSELGRVGPTRLDQFMDWMHAHSDVRVLDLRPALRAARADDRPGDFLYFEEGSHWNGRGCQVAFGLILAELARDFPAVEGIEGARVWKRRHEPGGETWRAKMYLDPDPARTWHTFAPADGVGRTVLFPETEPTRRVREQRVPTSGLPRALLFHDSFGPSVEWQLSEHCASLREIQTYFFPAEELLSAPTDVVIEIFVERVLAGLDPLDLVPPPLPAELPEPR